MSPTKLEMQPTIHWKVKLDIYRVHVQLYVVGCIFNSVGLIITRESLCIIKLYKYTFIFFKLNFITNSVRQNSDVSKS
jgi:hypothetical protein